MLKKLKKLLEILQKDKNDNKNKDSTKIEVGYYPSKEAMEKAKRNFPHKKIYTEGRKD